MARFMQNTTSLKSQLSYPLKINEVLTRRSTQPA